MTALTNESHKDCGGQLFGKNTDGANNMNKPIANIVETEDGFISFEFMGGGKSPINPVVEESDPIIYTKSIRSLIEDAKFLIADNHYTKGKTTLQNAVTKAESDFACIKYVEDSDYTVGETMTSLNGQVIEVMTALQTAIDDFVYSNAHVDVTEKVLNSSFNMDGNNSKTVTSWKVTNLKQNRRDAAIYSTTRKNEDGTAYIVHDFVEQWCNSSQGKLPDSGDIHQVVSGLPAGHYRLTADCFAHNQLYSVDCEEAVGIQLYANDVVREIGLTGFDDATAAAFSVDVDIAKGEDLTIGFRYSDTNVNWLGWDNVTLFFVGNPNIDPNPEDMEAVSLITNGDMTSLDGWDILVPGANPGLHIQNPNNEYPNFSKPFMECWVNNAPYGRENYARQTITTLPNGKPLPAGRYRLKATALATRQDQADLLVSGVTLKLGDQEVSVHTSNGVGEVYTLYYDKPTAGGELTFGLFIDKNTDANWIAWDEVELLYLSNSNTDPDPEEIPSTKYTLTYIVDGITYKTYEKEKGEVLTIEDEPVKEGYTFSGWGGIPSVMPAKDVTITGSFIINKYTLTYQVDNETYKTYQIEYGASITPEEEPAKNGCAFSGWSIIPQTMPAKNVMVTGEFIVNKYMLTYMVDGKSYKTYQLEYGSSIVPDEEPTKEGYTFSGWSIIPQTMPAKDVIVTGSFTKGQYKLVYMVDGQTYKIIGMDFGNIITAEDIPEKEGYTFSGWNNIPATMPAHDVAVSGSFTVNKYNLIYMVNDEVYKTYEVKYGTKITIEAVPTKEGHSFSGWSWAPSKMPAEDVIVTGTFTINSYTLTYIVDGEIYKTYKLDYGAKITPETDPVKESYIFNGWGEIPATMPAKDVTIIGSFTYVDAIADVKAAEGVYQIYTIDGKVVGTLQKGVNVIRYTNGKVKKVFVK